MREVGKSSKSMLGEFKGNLYVYTVWAQKSSHYAAIVRSYSRSVTIGIIYYAMLRYNTVQSIDRTRSLYVQFMPP